MYTEIVKGTIIGKSYKMGRVYYNNLPQGQTFYGTNDNELMSQAKKIKTKLLAKHTQLYSEDKWELRIWD